MTLTTDEIDRLIAQGKELKLQLIEARKSVTEKLNQVDELIRSLPDGAGEGKIPVESLHTADNAPQTLDDLILRTCRLANRPMSSKEITAVVSSVRPTAPYVISSTLSRLKKNGELKVRGPRGSYQFSVSSTASS